MKTAGPFRFDPMLLMNQEPSNNHSIPAFAPLVSNAFDHLTGLPAKIEIPKGTVLVRQGFTGEPVSLVQNGLVKLVSVGQNGRLAMLGLRSSGWYAGAASAVLSTVSIYSVITLTRCSIMRSPARSFVARLGKDLPLTMHFLSTLASETISMARLRVHLTADTAEERLCAFMRERTFPDPEWEVRDPLPQLKQVDLAHLLALTPEHLNRTLRKMKQGSKVISD